MPPRGRRAPVHPESGANRRLAVEANKPAFNMCNTVLYCAVTSKSPPVQVRPLLVPHRLPGLRVKVVLGVHDGAQQARLAGIEERRAAGKQHVQHHACRRRTSRTAGGKEMKQPIEPAAAQAMASAAKQLRAPRRSAHLPTKDRRAALQEDSGTNIKLVMRHG